MVRRAAAVALALAGCELVLDADDLERRGERNEVVLVVESDADDGEVFAATHYPQGESALGLAMGRWDGEYTWGYFRFEIPDDVPEDAVIVTATLELSGNQVEAGWMPASDSLVASIEDVDDAMPVAEARQPDVAATSVRWPAEGGLEWLLEGEWNASPDVAPLLNARLERGPMLAGQHVQLWVRSDLEGVNGQAEVSTFDFSVDEDRAARLTFVWRPGP